eukprot:751768-Prorocentrum_minimum.AAC.4
MMDVFLWSSSMCAVPSIWKPADRCGSITQTRIVKTNLPIPFDGHSIARCDQEVQPYCWIMVRLEFPSPDESFPQQRLTLNHLYPTGLALAWAFSPELAWRRWRHMWCAKIQHPKVPRGQLAPLGHVRVSHCSTDASLRLMTKAQRKTVKLPSAISEVPREKVEWHQVLVTICSPVWDCVALRLL